MKRLPLRARKYAQTKLALMQTAVAWMEEKSLDEIAIKELCEAVEVSEATFYNYFPKKTDLLVYFIQLWTTETIWHIRQRSDLKGLPLIEYLFDYMAEYSQKHPRVLGEVLIFYVRKQAHPTPHTITPAERLLAYPDCHGIEDIHEESLDVIFFEHLTYATQNGQLAPTTDIPAVILSLNSFLLGTPIAAKLHDLANLAPLYRQQLAMLWAAGEK